MKINITKKQYLLLLKSTISLSHISETLEDEDLQRELQELNEYLYSFGEDFSIPEIEKMSLLSLLNVSGFPEEMKEKALEIDGEYGPSTDFFNSVLELLDAYEYESFEKQLVIKLVMNDIIKNHGGDEFNNLPEEEKENIVLKYKDIYIKELEKNGTENISIKKTLLEI